MLKIRTTESGKAHQCNLVHYNDNYKSKKSQWRPPEQMREFKLFEEADVNQWTDGTTDYWAVEVSDSAPNVVGVDSLARDCRIVRFRRDVNTAPWHGYPITLTRKGEKFPVEILRIWNSSSILGRAWLSKMKRRQL